ncbi:MAG: thiolase family protein [Myxococcales bacterium]|nr:thiolase family protein [Myxococcales bacterium]
MTLPDDLVILDGARTPVGRFLGGLASVSATQLATVAARGALQRSGVDPTWVDQVVVGNVLQSSKDAAYIARHVGLDAGVPETVPALAVNRACGSGIEALVQGAKALALGEARFVLAGGAENMSQMPYALRGVRSGWRMVRSDVDDMLFSALHDPKAGCSIGETVEHLAEACEIHRQQADAYAMEAQQRAATAQAAGVYAEEIVPVEATKGRKTTTVQVDEGPRPDTTADGLAALPPLYGGVITAGNSTGLNDAAAMVVMSRATHAAEHHLPVLGRVVSWGTVGIAPLRMGLGPVAASQQALERAGLSLSDMDLVEINDSFAVQYLAVEQALELDRERVNVNGGAIALGHPMGATGTRLVLAALYELRRRGGRYALCTVCIGGGQGIAMVVELVSLHAGPQRAGDSAS